MMRELGAVPLSNALCLWMRESPVDGEEVEQSRYAAGLHAHPLGCIPWYCKPAHLGSGPGWGVVLYWRLVDGLPGPARSPGCEGCREGGRGLVPDKGPVEL